jgi:carbohydrate-selective porin OprB
MFGRVFVLLVLGTTVAHADEFATSPARPGYEAHETILAWPARTQLDKDGFRLEGTYAVEMFAAPQLDKRLTLAGMFVAELDVDFEHLVHEDLGVLRISAVATHGNSPNNELMDVHASSGNTAPTDQRLFEAWYEHEIGPVTLRGGLLAADQEFNYADATSTLLSATFGVTAQFSFNAGAPVYPVAAPGLSANAKFFDERFMLQAGIYDGSLENTRGIPTAIGPAYLTLVEATVDLDYGIGAWHHSELGDGIYGTFDHHLDEHVEAFTRIGLSDYGIRTYIDAGVRVGPIRDDFINVALAFAQLDTGAQTIVEGTYEAQIRWLTIQPALQMIMMREQTVGIFATRATVVF